MDEILVPRWLLEGLTENTEALYNNMRDDNYPMTRCFVDMLLNELEHAKALLNEESPN